MKYNRWSYFFILSVLFLALLPYFIICFYALPFADDFCFGWTASEKITFIQKFLDQYLYWNGRFTSDILVQFHPLLTGKLLCYRLVFVFALLITPLSIYIFIGEVFPEVKGLVAMTVSLLLTLFYLNYMPNITEGVYWYIGIVNYHFGNICLILQLLFFFKLFSANGKRKTFFTLFSFLLLIASIGFNENAALLIPLLYLCMLVFYTGARGKAAFIHFGVALISSAFVFFSPGNLVRGNAFTESHDFFHSLYYSSLQTIRFTGNWSYSISFWALSLVVVSQADKIQNKFLQQIDYKLIFAFLILVVFSGSFLPYFATGVLGQHRTINFVFFFFILLWVLFLISVSHKFSLYQKLTFLKDEKIRLLLLIIGILFMCFSGNSLKIVSGFRKNNFATYQTAFKERQKTIILNPEFPIPQLTSIPEIFQIVDVKGDTTWWADKCMKNFYTTTKTELR